MIALQTKKNIDVLVPVLLASGIGFWYFQKKQGRDWKLLVALMLVVFGIAYLVTTKITKIIREQGPHTELTPDATNVDYGSFKPKGYVDPIKEDAYRPWYSIGTRDIAAYQSLAALANWQLQLCYNYWSDNYYSLNSESLAKAIAEESAILDPGFASAQATLAQKFAALNLQ